MTRLVRSLLALFAVFAATPAMAIDTSFHTYDGFAETVDAFRRSPRQVRRSARLQLGLQAAG